jgi:hypothetical protein
MDDALNNCGPNYRRKGVDGKLQNAMPSTNVNNTEQSNGDAEKPSNAQAYPNSCHSSKTSKHVVRSAQLWGP